MRSARPFRSPARLHRAISRQPTHRPDAPRVQPLPNASRQFRDKSKDCRRCLRWASLILLRVRAMKYARADVVPSTSLTASCGRPAPTSACAADTHTSKAPARQVLEISSARSARSCAIDFSQCGFGVAEGFETLVSLLRKRRIIDFVELRDLGPNVGDRALERGMPGKFGPPVADPESRRLG